MKYQSQKVALYYIYGALTLFAAQILFGVVAGTVYVFPNFLSELLPFNVIRMIHTNALIVWLVVLGLAAGFSTVPLPADPLRLIAGILLAWMLGASFGRLAAILADISDSAQRIVPIILRPLFWVSGIFFIASELPDAALSVLWFNPLLHIVEYIRTGMFSNFSSHVATPFVPIAFSMVFYGASRMIEDTPTYRRLVSRR